ATLVALVTRRGAHREAPLQRTDGPRLFAMAAFVAVLGPVALAWGLQRTSGSSASLMLTLEVLFTAGLAWRWYGERMDRRTTAAMLILLAGGVALVVEQGFSGRAQLLGLLAVLLATAAWGVDNALSRGVAERDPGRVVLVKAALGTCATTVLAMLFGEAVPTLWAALGLVAIGATGYGLSLRLYLLAQRAFGAARTGSVFAFAPFMGAIGAFALGDRSMGWGMALGAALMLLGLLLHLSESHEHAHEHEQLGHEHAHEHGDGHHQHSHDPMPQGAHSHWHRHAAQRHSHPHVPDAHHLHEH
ncbi:EamA family transporter, partial [Hydrogenophaga sp.]|uniref:DMT family transporter n=1 Tax=Hydrogenophaga sp. TaxID=1904254 RepID=UPI003565AD59